MNTKPTVTICDLPIPPSDNALFRDARVGHGKTRRVLATPYRLWLKTMEQHRYIHKRQLTAFAQIAKGQALAVEIHLYLPPGTVFTAGHKALDPVQRFDASNRIKAICDWLATVLNIDDRYFFTVYVSKHAMAGKLHPSIDVTITTIAAIHELRKAANI